MNTSCSHFKRSLFIELKAKVFTRLVSLQTPVVIHHRERESMTVRRWMEGATEEAPQHSRTTTLLSRTVRRETAWELWNSSVEATTTVVALKRPTIRSYNSPWLSRHCDASRTSSSQSSNVTSKLKQDLRMLKPLSAPIKPDRSWVSLPTHNQRGEHQARKNNLCSPRTRRRLQ